MKRCWSASRLCLAAVSVFAICALMGGCAATTFPTVLADPPPPAETPLSPDQIKQAVDSLISDRNRQCSEAIADAQPGDPRPDCGVATTGTTPNSGAAAKP